MKNNQQQNLKRGLLPRHVQFIALAGMIGTGIFKGSSDTLNMAGPSVVAAYLVGGLLLFIVMAALGEMAIVYPNLNVQHLVLKAFGFRTSFIFGALLLVVIVPSPIHNPISNLLGHGGFFPHGIQGTLNAFLVVMFSYGGAELIGVAVTETKDAEKVLPKVIKSTIWRIIIFY